MDYVEAKLNHHKRLHIAIFRPLFCVITCKRSCTCAMINLIRPVFIFPSIHDLKTRPQAMKIDVWIELFFLPFLTFHTIIFVGQNGATVRLEFIVDLISLWIRRIWYVNYIWKQTKMKVFIAFYLIFQTMLWCLCMHNVLSMSF